MWRFFAHVHTMASCWRHDEEAHPSFSLVDIVASSRKREEEAADREDARGNNAGCHQSHRGS